MLAVMDKNRKNIETELGTLVFYMQGGLDFNDAYSLNSDQRKILAKVIEKHYKAMNGKKDSQLIGGL